MLNFIYASIFAYSIDFYFIWNDSRFFAFLQEMKYEYLMSSLHQLKLNHETTCLLSVVALFSTQVCTLLGLKYKLPIFYFSFCQKKIAFVKTVQAVIALINHNSGGYNRTPRPAVWPAKIYLARLLPAALLRLHRPLLQFFRLSSSTPAGTLFYTGTSSSTLGVPV